MKRVPLGSLLAFVVPLAAGAQQPAANPMVQTFRSFGTQYGGWLSAAFDSIPESKYSYKPTPVQLTVGYIAQHLESANYLLCAHWSGQTHAMTAKDSLADTVKAKWPKDTLVARLKASFAYCDAALAKVNDASLAESIPRIPASAGTAPRVRFLILYVTDLADHYSQIANYMRLNGLTPPSALPRPRP
jgi:hypothetical protein